MKNVMKLSLVAVNALAFAGIQVQAAVIPINAVGGIYNTGVDATGAVLADGTVDSNYVITASVDGPSTETAKSSASGFPIPPWLGDNSVSRWIGETAGYPSLNEGTGLFNNQTTFTSPIAGTVTIVGQWATDNAGSDILINGVSTGATSSGFSAFAPFTITAPVVVGVNTLDLVQTNAGGPGGVRAEFSSASVTPEPASLSLLGLGGLSLLARRRKA